MAVYRVERTRDYTVMSNHHLKDSTLSLKAKGLLSMFLSFPEDWNYSTRGLAAICKEGVEAVGNTIRELEKAGYIVRRTLRGANGRITDTEYIIYERPRKADTQPDTATPSAPAPDAEEPDTSASDTTAPDTAMPDTTSPHPGNPYPVGSDAENRAQLNTKVTNTQKIKNLSDHPSFFPSVSSQTMLLPAERMDGESEVIEKREDIRERIEYDRITDSVNQVQVDEFVEIILEVSVCRSPTIKIGRDAEYPTAFVQQRFEQINSEHIEKVLAGIRENTTRVRNTKAYLLAALFNAPSTTDNHYTMLVNHDMNSGY